MIFAVFAVLSLTNLFAETSGFAMLEMPTSAKSAATMGVFTSQACNGMSLFENPVGIYCEESNINFTNNFWFADVNQSVLTLGHNTKWGTFGLGLNFVNSPEIEVRTRPTDEPEGEIEAQYLVAALGFTREIIKGVRMGVNAKYLYESLYTENASGFAVDVAALWQMPSNMDLAVRLSNLGGMSELKSESTNLPTSFEIGLVRPKLLAEGGMFNLAMGIFFNQNLVSDETEIKFGGEAVIYEKLFVRGGYSIQQEFNDMSFGAGFNVKKFKFDFGMIMMDEIPDYPYSCTISYDL